MTTDSDHITNHPVVSDTNLAFCMDSDLRLPIFNITPNQGPLGERLLSYTENWKQIMSDDWILNVISKGYKLQFLYHLLLVSRPVGQGFWKGPNYEQPTLPTRDTI